MSKVLVVDDLASKDVLAVVLKSGDRNVVIPNGNGNERWAKSVSDGNVSLEDVVMSLGDSIDVKEVPLSALAGKIDRVAQQYVRTLIAEAKGSAKVSTSKGFVGTPRVIDLPLSSFDKESRNAVVNYKAAAFLHDQHKSRFPEAYTSLRLKIGGPGPTLYDPYAQDGDGDGFVQDETPWERPDPGKPNMMMRAGRRVQRLGRTMTETGERRKRRNLARQAARQRYDDERQRINNQFPSVASRAMRRMRGRSQRVRTGVGLRRRQPQRRQQQGKTPKPAPIFTRAADRAGEWFENLIERVENGRRGKPAKRVVNQKRPSKRVQKGKAPSNSGILRRAARRTGQGLDDLFERLMTPRGYQTSRSMRRGGTLPGPQKRVITPGKPKGKPGAKPTPSTPSTPTAKPKQKVPYVDTSKLSPAELDDLIAAGLEEFDALDAAWRKRLGIDDTVVITPDMMKKYIDDRKAKKSPGPYIGMLSAMKNDYEAMVPFHGAAKAANTFDEKAAAAEHLNNVGPTRRQRILSEAALIPKPTPSPKPTPKPAPKPAVPVMPNLPDVSQSVDFDVDNLDNMSLAFAGQYVYQTYFGLGDWWEGKLGSLPESIDDIDNYIEAQIKAGISQAELDELAEKRFQYQLLDEAFNLNPIDPNNPVQTIKPRLKYLEDNNWPELVDGIKEAIADAQLGDDDDDDGGLPVPEPDEPTPGPTDVTPEPDITPEPEDTPEPPAPEPTPEPETTVIKIVDSVAFTQTEGELLDPNDIESADDKETLVNALLAELDAMGYTSSMFGDGLVYDLIGGDPTPFLVNEYLNQHGKPYGPKNKDNLAAVFNSLPPELKEKVLLNYKSNKDKEFVETETPGTIASLDVDIPDDVLENLSTNTTAQIPLEEWSDQDFQKNTQKVEDLLTFVNKYLMDNIGFDDFFEIEDTDEQIKWLNETADYLLANLTKGSSTSELPSKDDTTDYFVDFTPDGTDALLDAAHLFKNIASMLDALPNEVIENDGDELYKVVAIAYNASPTGSKGLVEQFSLYAPKKPTADEMFGAENLPGNPEYIKILLNSATEDPDGYTIPKVIINVDDLKKELLKNLKNKYPDVDFISDQSTVTYNNPKITNEAIQAALINGVLDGMSQADLQDLKDLAQILDVLKKTDDKLKSDSSSVGVNLLYLLTVGYDPDANDTAINQFEAAIFNALQDLSPDTKKKISTHITQSALPEPEQTIDPTPETVNLPDPGTDDFGVFDTINMDDAIAKAKEASTTFGNSLLYVDGDGNVHVSPVSQAQDLMGTGITVGYFENGQFAGPVNNWNAFLEQKLNITPQEQVLDVDAAKALLPVKQKITQSNPPNLKDELRAMMDLSKYDNEPRYLFAVKRGKGTFITAGTAEELVGRFEAGDMPYLIWHTDGSENVRRRRGNETGMMGFEQAISDGNSEFLSDNPDMGVVKEALVNAISSWGFQSLTFGDNVNWDTGQAGLRYRQKYGVKGWVGDHSFSLTATAINENYSELGEVGDSFDVIDLDAIGSMLSNQVLVFSQQLEDSGSNPYLLIDGDRLVFLERMGAMGDFTSLLRVRNGKVQYLNPNGTTAATIDSDEFDLLPTMFPNVKWGNVTVAKTLPIEVAGVEKLDYSPIPERLAYVANRVAEDPGLKKTFADASDEALADFDTENIGSIDADALSTARFLAETELINLLNSKTAEPSEEWQQQAAAAAGRVDALRKLQNKVDVNSGIATITAAIDSPDADYEEVSFEKFPEFEVQGFDLISPESLIQEAMETLTYETEQSEYLGLPDGGFENINDYVEYNFAVFTRQRLQERASELLNNASVNLSTDEALALAASNVAQELEELLGPVLYPDPFTYQDAYNFALVRAFRASLNSKHSSDLKTFVDAQVEEITETSEVKIPTKTKQYLSPEDSAELGFFSEAYDLPNTLRAMVETVVEGQASGPQVLYVVKNGDETHVVMGSFEEFKQRNADGLVQSVIAGVVPDGRIYIATDSNQTNNPVAKWESKFSKYGTPAFKTPIGAKHVFDSDDMFANLDSLEELLADGLYLVKTSNPSSPWVVSKNAPEQPAAIGSSKTLLPYKPTPVDGSMLLGPGSMTKVNFDSSIDTDYLIDQLLDAWDTSDPIADVLRVTAALVDEFDALGMPASLAPAIDFDETTPQYVKSVYQNALEAISSADGVPTIDAVFDALGLAENEREAFVWGLAREINTLSELTPSLPAGRLKKQLDEDNFPSNPSGKIWGPTEPIALAELSTQHAVETISGRLARYRQLLIGFDLQNISNPNSEKLRRALVMHSQSELVSDVLAFAATNPHHPHTAPLLKAIADELSKMPTGSFGNETILRQQLSDYFANHKGLPKKSAPKTGATVAIIPDAVFAPGEDYKPSLVGTFNEAGAPVSPVIPTGSMSISEATQKLSDGEDIANIPDELLREAIQQNAGPGKRFHIIVDPQASGYNGAPLIVADTKYPSGDPANPIYPRYVIKSAHRNAQEHMAQRTSNYVGHKIGIPTMGVRFAGPTVMKTDKNGVSQEQRDFLMEHAQNIFLGVQYDLSEERLSQMTLDPDLLEPLALGRLIAFNRILNHYDRTQENTRIVQTPPDSEGKRKIVVLPIDDGNAMQPWKKGNSVSEQDAGFTSSGKGVGEAWLNKYAAKMSKENKVAVAAEMRRAVNLYRNLDEDSLASDLADAGLTPAEQKMLSDQIQYLIGRQQSMDWDAMLAQAYEILGVTETELDEFDANNDRSVIERFKPEIIASSTTTALQSLRRQNPRNLGVTFRWGGADVRDARVTTGDVVLENAPGTDGPVRGMYTIFRLDGDAKESIGDLLDDGEGNLSDEWETVLMNEDSDLLTEPILPTYRTANKALTYRRRLDYKTWSTKERVQKTGGNGSTYKKTLPDGTEVYVHIAAPSGGNPAKKNAYYGHVIAIMRTESDNPEVLAISNYDEKLKAVGEAVGVASPSMATPEEYLSFGVRNLAANVFGPNSPSIQGKTDDELIKMLAEMGWSINDIEMATDINGTPYVRLTKAARKRVLQERGFRYAQHKITSGPNFTAEEGLKQVLRSGSLGGAQARFDGGVDYGGMSVEADVRRGGSNKIFMYNRNAPEEPLPLDDVESPLPLQFGSQGGQYTIVVPGEFAIERLDTRISTPGDNYGDSDDLGVTYGGDLESDARQFYLNGNLSLGRAMVVISDAAPLKREDLIKMLKSQGITHYDGVPIELVITTYSNRAEAFKALKAYWAKIGLM